MRRARCPPYMGLRFERECGQDSRPTRALGLNGNVGRPFVIAGAKAGRMPALQVAKKYQKSGICGLQMNCLIMQNTVVQLDAE